jgi:DHA2 family multidrug resistance protein
VGLARSAAGHFAQIGDAAHAQLQALKEIALQVTQQASVMTFSETFHALAVVLLLCIPLALLLKTPKPGAVVDSNAH